MANHDKGQPRGRAMLRRGDITALRIACIVNAANTTLLGGGGVDGAIHRAAGPQLKAACAKIGGCATGQAVITRGYRLGADYVIHTVGPIYSNDERDAPLLAACYENSLDLAAANDIEEIAFPAISCGAYGYPVEKAVPIAVETVRAWFRAHPAVPMRVFFVAMTAAIDEAYRKYLDAHPF